MKRTTAAILLTVLLIGVIDTHVDLQTIDQKRLVNVNGATFDPKGWLLDKAQLVRRDCLLQARPSADSAVGVTVLNAVAQYSPPDSASVQWNQARQDGDWLIAELSFDQLNPVVALLTRQGDRWELHPRAIWSGSTAPWYPSTRIREHLRQQAPEAPQGLIECFKPLRDFRSLRLL